MSREQLPPPQHDPTGRVLVGRERSWEIRQFDTRDPRFAYFARRGFLHVQLWDRARAVSILTPSRLTGGKFELWTARRGRFAAADWTSVRRQLDDPDQPGESWAFALERWFVAPHEPAQLRLARLWWRRPSTRKEGT